MFFSLWSDVLNLSHSSIPLRRKAFTTKLSPETWRTDQSTHRWGIYSILISSKTIFICPHLRGFLCACTLYVETRMKTRRMLVWITTTLFLRFFTFLTMFGLKFAHSSAPLLLRLCKKRYSEIRPGRIKH